MCCLPTVPLLCPQGRRRRKAHRARGRATSLNPHSASTTSLSPRQHIWLFLPPSLEPTRADPHPVATSPLGNVGATQCWGPLRSPLPPQDPSLQPSGTASCKKPNLWSLPEKPCPLCCLASPTCALPSSLYLSPWAAPWGAPTPRFPSGVMSGILQGKATWGKTERTKKINFHWPSGEPRVFARKLWWLSVVCGGSRFGVGRMEVGPWAWWAAQGSWLGLCPRVAVDSP